MMDCYVRALEICDREKPDFGLALQLLEEGSRKGDVKSKYALATWLLHGKEGVVEKNAEEGFNILSSLSKSNIAEALYDLAICYDLGDGITQDEHRSFSLYMQAALLGDVQACVQVAEFYREGKLVQPDDELYDAWMQRSGELEKAISPPYRVWLR